MKKEHKTGCVSQSGLPDCETRALTVTVSLTFSLTIIKFCTPTLFYLGSFLRTRLSAVRLPEYYFFGLPPFISGRSPHHNPQRQSTIKDNQTMPKSFDKKLSY